MTRHARKPSLLERLDERWQAAEARHAGVIRVAVWTLLLLTAIWFGGGTALMVL